MMLFSLPFSRPPCTAAHEEVIQQYKQSNEQQQVNEASRDMGQQTDEPQDYQDDYH
jgi:hypothetical protein